MSELNQNKYENGESGRNPIIEEEMLGQSSASDDENDEKFEILEDEESGLEEDKEDKKSIYSSKPFLIFAGIILLCSLVLASFYLMGSSNSQSPMVVRDNSANSKSPTNDYPDFQKDIEDKYQNENSNTNLNNQSPEEGNSLNQDTSKNISDIPTTETGNSPNSNDGIFQTEVLNKQQDSEIDKVPKENGKTENSSVGTTGGNGSSVKGTSDGNLLSASGGNVNSKESDLIDLKEITKGPNRQISLTFANNQGRTSKVNFLPTNSSSTSIKSLAKPFFGTVLPVRLLSTIHTLGANSLVRMELTQTIEGRWGSIKKGTLFVGRVQGGQGNRVFVSLIGYIDIRTNSLVTFGGDVHGKDGALGLVGKRKKLSSRWKKVFGEVLNSAKELAVAYLNGRNGGTNIYTGETERLITEASKKLDRYIIAKAGSVGSIMVTELPPAFNKNLSYTRQRLLGQNKRVSDSEIQRIADTEDESELERLMPKLSRQGQNVARQ